MQHIDEKRGGRILGDLHETKTFLVDTTESVKLREHDVQLESY